MDDQETIERIIREYFLSPEAAGPKLDEEKDGTLFDSDSNWGFDPAELARRILAALSR